MPKLKPWYQVVTPREDLRAGRPLDASEFAVHLDHVREGRAPDDYQLPERFFERTYLTRTLRDLAIQVVRRLSGQRLETSAVFNMATQFGGGKTHALTLLYHLARVGPPARSWTGVPAILAQAGVADVPRADTAAFVGTEFDSLAGRGGDDGTPLRKTPWGEIAFQLGGAPAFAVVAEHDARGIAPAGDVIRAFLPPGPVLILMDELMNYISRNRRSGLSAQLYSFLQNLAEEARARDNLVLAVSIPASELEMNAEDQRDHESIKKLLDRLGKAVIMSAETESAEIIRRRLFEWGGLPEEGARAAAAYADWAIDNQEILGDVDVDSIRDRFRAAYPFHPAVLSVFERKWQSLPRFQRTRGVLRLLALWVSHAYQAGYSGAHRDPLVGLGTAPLADPYFRAAALEQLGSDALEVPITTDIVGKPEAHALRLDREAGEEIREGRLHQKVATAIFFESNGGMTKAEATLPELRFAVGEPDASIAHVETTLEGLAESCYYLTYERNRYRYGLSPNLNKVLTDRRAAIPPAVIDERITQEMQSVFKSGPASPARIYFPEKSGQIPDRAALTLVVLSPSQPLSLQPTRTFIESLIREHGLSGRTFKSALIFAVPDGASTLHSDARGLLALEDIADDHDTVARLDESQTRLLKTSLTRAGRDLREAVWRAYKHLVLLGKDNALKEIDLGLVHSSAAGSLTELIVNRLRQDDILTEAVGPHKLVRYWPPALTAWSTKAARDAFFSSPALPRLLDPEAIRRTIADGVAQKVLAYAARDADGRFDPLHFGVTLAPIDIEISDDMYLLTAEEAIKHIEPPRLVRLLLHPTNLTLQPGGTASLTVTGYDQHGRPLTIADPQWSADDGTIEPDGAYAAPYVAGAYTVTVRAGNLEARAQVQVASAQREGTGIVDPPPPPPPPPARGIRWQGTIPAQKWMNFYMKVLTRFAARPSLTITVGFQVDPGPDLTQSQIEDTRVALRELGLSEDLHQ